MKKIFSVLLLSSLALMGLEPVLDRGGLSVNWAENQYAAASENSSEAELESFSCFKNLQLPRTLKQGESCSWKTNVPVLGDNERYRLVVVLKGRGEQSIEIDTYAKDGSAARPKIVRKASDDKEKRTFDWKFFLLEGTSEIALRINQTSGKSEILSVILVPCRIPGTRIAARLLPMCYMDNIYAIGEQDAGMFCLGLQALKKNQPRPRSLYFVLTLPKGFRLEAVTHNLEMTASQPGTAGTTYRIQERFHSYPTGNYVLYQSSGLIISTDLKAGEQLYPMSYHLEYDGIKTSFYTGNLKVIPRFRGRTPKKFISGAIAESESVFTDKGRGADLCADQFKKHGFNAMEAPPYRELMMAMKRKGLIRYATNWCFANGYDLGTHPKPDSARMVGADGKFVDYDRWHQAICPVEVYTRGEYYRRHVIGWVDRTWFQTDISDHIMTNWEPERYDGKGCFCERCFQDFLKYSRLPEKAVRLVWKNGKIRETHQEVWLRFRAWQHGRMMETMDQDIAALGKKYGREIHFLPEICWGDMYPEMRYRFAQYTAQEYMGKMRWLEPWGPYIGVELDRGYVENPGEHLGTYISARQIPKNILKKVQKASAVPQIAAFPHALQGPFSWLTSPEAMAYETLAYFVTGWDASFLYLFPCGYDARYWNTMAEANHAIAFYEDTVMQGRRRNDIGMKIETPLPGPMHPLVDSRVFEYLKEQIRTTAFVTLDAFEDREKIVLALGNAWENGEAFVTVKIPGLDPAATYTVTAPHRNLSLGTFTGKTLADGILLQVGALRFAFYQIEKGKTAAGRLVDQKTMRNLMARALPELKKNYALSMKILDSDKPVIYNFALQPSLSGGDLRLVPRDGVSSSVLKLEGAVYDLEVEMGKGGIVRKICSRAVSGSENDSFARDAFWDYTGMQVTLPYVMKDWKISGDALMLILERILPPQTPSVGGMKIVRTYLFRKDSFELEVSLQNATAKPVHLKYRMHSYSAFFNKNFQLKGKGLNFSRKNKSVFLRKAGAAYRGLPFDAVAGGEFQPGSLRLQNGKNFFDVSIGDMRNLAGIYIWDMPKNSACTFEILFEPVVLKPGKSVEYCVKWSFKKGDVK